MEVTYLFVPGTHYERIGKALASPADAVIIDLEDGVTHGKKENARHNIEKALSHFQGDEKQIYVRINDVKSKYWQDDVHFINKYPSLGVMLPKTETKDDIRILEESVFSERKIIPLIETAKGIIEAPEIAAASRNIYRLAFGAVDYCFDLGIEKSEDETELLYPRSVLVTASRAAGLISPIDTVYTDIHDEKGLVRETKLAKQLGLFAKLCIHPKQIHIVKKVLKTEEDEYDWAKKVVTAFEKAEMEGLAAIQLNGKMIDYPVYKRALAILNGKR